MSTYHNWPILRPDQCDTKNKKLLYAVSRLDINLQDLKLQIKHKIFFVSRPTHFSQKVTTMDTMEIFFHWS